MDPNSIEINFADVAKHIRVPTEYILKFISIEFGSIYSYKEKGSEVSCIVKGNIPENEMLKCLDKFIDKYVLCPGCNYPEMNLRVRKDQVCGQCGSCGKKSIVDSMHKIARFIV
jgi:translation initiation factor 5